MFNTNIVSVNNFYKRFASVFITIALVMMTSMLVACGKKEDIVHSQECNVIVETGSSGYSLGDYEDQNLVTYTFSEEELGKFMFGYIVVHKPELKVREYETYRASYCGLCHIKEGDQETWYAGELLR